MAVSMISSIVASVKPDRCSSVVIVEAVMAATLRFHSVSYVDTWHIN